jgi:hypothetical protein
MTSLLAAALQDKQIDAALFTEVMYPLLAETLIKEILPQTLFIEAFLHSTAI